ncbi:hypothetical protein NOGI109294_22775 [Nocardiopsis gilva]
MHTLLRGRSSRVRPYLHAVERKRAAQDVDFQRFRSEVTR